MTGESGRRALLTDFFNFKIERSDGLGFGLFTQEHGMFILLCLSLTALLCLAYRSGGKRRRRVLGLATALAALALELSRALLLSLSGDYGLSRLPLHLCTMAAYLLPLYALARWELLGQFLYAFCMPGAAAAILLPDWSYYPPLHFMTFCGFALHALIFCYPLMLALSGDLRPDTRQLPECIALMAAMAVPVYVFNKISGTNYMFLNWPPEGTPLAWFAFLGRPCYVLAYLPLFSAVWAATYSPFYLKKYKKSAD